MKAGPIILIAAIAMACSPTPNGKISVEVTADDSFTGRGNCNETMLEVTVNPEPYKAPLIKSFDIVLDAPDSAISDVLLISEGRTLCRRTVDDKSNRYFLKSNEPVSEQKTYSICVNVRDDAPEGSVISATLVGLTLGGNLGCLPDSSTTAKREVLLARKALFMPGDHGSKYWRIPAIRQLSDGTLLVVNDRRNDSQEDLPNEIDVVSRYSTDGGRTWSEPVYIAKNMGRMHGYGDPGLAELEDGTVICTFCGGQRLDKSCWSDPQRSYFSISKDHGRSWSEPEDITSSIWGPSPANPFCKRYNSSFFSSGNSLVLKNGEHKGRMLVANVTTYDSWKGICNHAVYTDDGGKSWNVSDLAYGDKGDEAKMVELKDGTILMSIRQNGERAFVTSSDGGVTWSGPAFWPEICTNACNGDLIRYNDDILLHSVPNSMQRENVSIFLSFDEGKTWPEHKSICHGPSVYSSLTVLQDGTIGAYIEEDPTGACELWYMNFSIDWLRAKKFE